LIWDGVGKTIQKAVKKIKPNVVIWFWQYTHFAFGVELLNNKIDDTKYDTEINIDLYEIIHAGVNPE